MNFEKMPLRNGPANKFGGVIFPLVFLLTLLNPEASGQKAEELIFTLSIKGKIIRVEAARTEEQKVRGLMFRESLGQDEGMLFVYDREEILSFWMKNTPLPLSIAFIDAKGRIVDLQDMQPFSLRTYVSAFPAKYALEMHQGWFKKNGIKVGDVVYIPPAVK